MCSKDCKKYGVAGGTAIVLMTAMEFVLHHVILRSAYQQSQYQLLWNSPETMQSRQLWMFLAYVLFGIVFTLVYTRGYEESKPPLGQGLRYGFWVGLMVFGFQSMMSYMVYPVSCGLACAWAVGGLIESMILGAVVSLIYRPHA